MVCKEEKLERWEESKGGVESVVCVCVSRRKG